MNSEFEKRLKLLTTPEGKQSLLGAKRGFEKESLRVTEQGLLAMTTHPRALGSSLMHPMITTDFAESLIEFITPATDSIDELFHSLEELHQYTYQSLASQGTNQSSESLKELLWNLSMPGVLPPADKICIAEYGKSNYGMLKHVYRLGLKHRYGNLMQTIAGIHYNFSFSHAFWEYYQPALAQFSKVHAASSLKDFISDQYLGLIRNTFRISGLFALWFGASPAITTTFLEEIPPWLTVDANKVYGTDATSLRMSDLGYHNKPQTENDINLNSFANFLDTLHHAVHTPDPEYAKIGVVKDGEYLQLSPNILQVEDEYYALLRPKRTTKTYDERMYCALKKEGVEYLEIRALDINPNLPLGVDKRSVYLLDAVLLTCLLMPSQALDLEERKVIEYNTRQAAKYGRNPKTLFKTNKNQAVSFSEFGLQFIEHLLCVATLLDEVYTTSEFTSACQAARTQLLDPSVSPSGIVLQELQKSGASYQEYGLQKSQAIADYFLKKPLSEARFQYYQNLAKDSLLQQQLLEQTPSPSFDMFLKEFLNA